jgi:hypothetical protein
MHRGLGLCQFSTYPRYTWGCKAPIRLLRVDSQEHHHVVVCRDWCRHDEVLQDPYCPTVWQFIFLTRARVSRRTLHTPQKLPVDRRSCNVFQLFCTVHPQCIREQGSFHCGLIQSFASFSFSALRGPFGAFVGESIPRAQYPLSASVEQRVCCIAIPFSICTALVLENMVDAIHCKHFV